MDEILALLMKPQPKVTEDFSFMNPKVREQVQGEGLGVEKYRVLSQSRESVFTAFPMRKLPQRCLKRTLTQAYDKDL